MEALASLQAQITRVTIAQQILGIEAQDHEGALDQILNGISLLGLLIGLFLILGTLWCIARCCHRRCLRATAAPEPVGEPDEEDEILPDNMQKPQHHKCGHLRWGTIGHQLQSLSLWARNLSLSNLHQLQQQQPPHHLCHPKRGGEEETGVQGRSHGATCTTRPQGAQPTSSETAQDLLRFLMQKSKKVQICGYCSENWPAGVPMTRELRHVWAQCDACRTPQLVDHFFTVRYDATVELPVCRHCRDGHIMRNP